MPIPPSLPARPIAATIAVVIRGEEVLLVRRANPPDAGRWGFPGGKIEIGETIQEAAVRELCEETSVRGEPLQAFAALDAFDRDEGGALRHHYVLLAVLCRWIAGEPSAGDDALEVGWFKISDLENDALVLSLDVAKVARQGANLM